MQQFAKSFFILPLAFVSLHAAAQTDSSAFKNLDEVIITGQYQPQSLKKSVYQVRVISHEQIQLRGATSVQQVLSDQLGFRFTNDNTLGISNVQLNGMGGNNVKILLDGVPMVDRYDERVSLSQIDVNNIDRIEIVEGPMSVSYGSDAMAGVINIITKKYSKNMLSVNARVQEETTGNEYYPFSYKGIHNQNANLDFRKKHLVAAIGGSHNDFDGFGGDAYGRGKTWKPKEQWLGFGKIGYATEHLNIYYRIDGLHEDISARNPINFNNYKATDQQYITNRYIHQLQGNFTVNSHFNLNSFLAYTAYDRETKTTRHNFETNSTEPNQAGENDQSDLNNISFKTTAFYEVSSIISFQPGIDINHEKASGARIQGSPQINDYAFFASAEIKPVAFMKLRPGFRLSANSQYDAPVITPSLNTRFELSDHWDLRLAYGYGFRAPTLRELYLTFFDANHSLVGNTNLKAEFSNSVNGSLTFHWESVHEAQLTSTLSGFYNAYNNQIELVQSITNPAEYTYYNIDKSKTAGGSFENKLNWKKLELSAGISYVGYASSQYDHKDFVKEDNRMYLWTPEINTNVIYNLDKIHTRLGLFYKFIGKKPAFSFGSVNNQDAILLTQTAAYNLADLTITTGINKHISTHIGMRNIFNVTNVENTTLASSGSAHSGAGALAIGYGRSFFLGLSFTWNKK